MMNKTSCLGVFIMVAGLLFGACTQPLTPTAEVKTPAAKVTTLARKADWEQKWESVLAEAKKGGAVAIYTQWAPEVRIALTQAFKDKYGINLEFSPVARGPEIPVKVQAEQRAGLYMADVFGGANSTLLILMKPEGLLGPIKPLLILPEVLDPQAWRDEGSGQRLPFTDKECLAFSMVRNVARAGVYNTDLVKEGEISSLKDVLKPQYKGKITLNDPSITGAGAALMAHLAYNLWGEAEAIDFLKRLIIDQKMVIQRDIRMHMESVARGKYAIALGETPSVVDELTKAGAPMKLLVVKEDDRGSASNGAFSVPTKFANPNATIIFVNWLLTKEGQSVFARAFGNASIRVDASTEGINPEFIPRPGVKYYLDDEEFMAATDKAMVIAKKVMDEAMK